jgi:hypothetical protein
MLWVHNEMRESQMNQECCTHVPAGQVAGFECDETFGVGGFEVDRAEWEAHRVEVHGEDGLVGEPGYYGGRTDA